MLNGMDLQRSIRRLVDWIHQAGDGEQREQHQGGEAQVVKDSRQRGAAASTAERCHGYIQGQQV